MSDYYEKTGFLAKRGKASKVDPNPAWKKRWFEVDLESKLLKYYKSQSDVSTKGDIALSGAILRVLRPSDKTYRPNAFAISGPNCKREYFLQAKTQQDLEEWMKAIEEAVATFSCPDSLLDRPKSHIQHASQQITEEKKKEEAPIELDFSLPESFRSKLGVRMSAWRSVAGLRGFMKQPGLVLKARTNERDEVLRTTCLAVRRGPDADPRYGYVASGNADGRASVVFYHPGNINRKQIKVQHHRTDDWRCTDMDWKNNTLLCGTDEGDLKAFQTVASEDGIEVTQETTLTRPEEKLKMADYGEWFASKRINHCEIHPLKNTTALCVSNSMFHLWDLNRPTKPVFSANGSADALFTCAWDLNKGHSFLLGGQSKSLKILDYRKLDNLNNAAAWKVPHAHSGGVRDVAWNPLIRWWLASAGADGDIKIWDVRATSDTPIFTLNSHLSAVNRICWSNAHCELLASAGVDRSMRLWNLRMNPHYLVHTETEFSTEVVGVGFSTCHPLKFHGISANGEKVESQMTEEFVRPFVQCRFKLEKKAQPKPGSTSMKAGSTVSASTKPSGSIVGSRLQTQRPSLRQQEDAPASYQVTEEDLAMEKRVEELLYQRNFKDAFKCISELASRYYENSMNQRAIDLLKLASGSLFRNLQQRTSTSMKNYKLISFVNDMAYFTPSNAVRLNQPNEADSKHIQLLKTRIALRTLVDKKAYSKIIDIKEEIVKQLSENGDAFSAQTIDGMVATILPENYLAALNFAMIIGNKLREKGTFAKNFVLVAKRLFAPTIFHGRGAVTKPAVADTEHPTNTEEMRPYMIGTGAQNSNSISNLDIADAINELTREDDQKDASQSQDFKAMERRLEREFRNPIIVLPQLKLINEIHMALSRAFSKNNDEVGSGNTILYQPAEVVISVVEKHRDEKDSPPQRILPSMVHRLYLNALIQRHKFDKAFVYATNLSNAIKGWDFAAVLDDILEHVACPRLKTYFDLALIHDRRRPWECQRVVQASLMLLRILHSCETLPGILLNTAEGYMKRFTSRLKASLEQIYMNPRYDGSQTLEVVFEIKSRGQARVDSRRDAEDLVVFIKQTVMKIREHGRGHQPLFLEAVEEFRDMLARMHELMKTGDLTITRSSRSSKVSQDNLRSLMTKSSSRVQRI